MLRRIVGLVVSLSFLLALAAPALAKGTRIRHSARQMKLMSQALLARAQQQNQASTKVGETKTTPARPKIATAATRPQTPVRRVPAHDLSVHKVRKMIPVRR